MNESDQTSSVTYARARLWLGITGVGSLVTIATLALVLDWPHRFFSARRTFGTREFSELMLFVIGYATVMFPFDFLGGFWVPRKYARTKASFSNWWRTYVPSVLGQGVFFLLLGTSLLMMSQLFGWLGTALTIVGGFLVCLLIRRQIVAYHESRSTQESLALKKAKSVVSSWNIDLPEVTIANHSDVGFTGGIIGSRKDAKIVIPQTWLKFSTNVLAVAIARRALAIQSGSYRRGWILALLWNAIGFAVCTLFSVTGLTTLAGLITTISAFTIWTFLGLLILPTLSRSASLRVDHELGTLGVREDLIQRAAANLDQKQDDEPVRPTLIEIIFHPIPNVSSRNVSQPPSGYSAWNVARTTLFFSWAFLGFLSRSVHCNVGRPELWTMLPSD